MIRWIEAAVDAHLAEEIKVLRPLHVEKERQSRIEKKPVAGIDERGRPLIDIIHFKIDQSAELQLKLILRALD